MNSRGAPFRSGELVGLE
jgi:hypothetical protein